MGRSGKEEGISFRAGRRGRVVGLLTAAFISRRYGRKRKGKGGVRSVHLEPTRVAPEKKEAFPLSNTCLPLHLQNREGRKGFAG